MNQSQRKIKKILEKYMKDNGINKAPTIQELKRNPSLPSDGHITKTFGTNSYPKALKLMNLKSNKGAKMTEEEVVELMKEYVDIHGESELTHAKFEKWLSHTKGRSTSFRKRLGNWNELKEKAGFGILKKTDYSPDGLVNELLNFMETFRNKHNRYPSRNEVEEGIKPIHISTIERKTGLKYRDIMKQNHIPVSHHWSDEELIESLHKEHKDTGQTPFFENFRKAKGKESVFKDGTIKPDVGSFNRPSLGGFRNAVIKAGYIPHPRGNGYSYASNHVDPITNETHIRPSKEEGLVDDLLQNVPHKHDIRYSDLIPGYQGGKDADITILNNPSLEKDYIIEVTGYMTRSQFFGKEPLPPGERVETYYRDLSEKITLIEESNFNGELILIFKGDDKEELLKDILKHFKPMDRKGTVLYKYKGSRKQNPIIHEKEHLVQLILEARKHFGRDPKRKEMHMEGAPHPTTYCRRFGVSRWNELLKEIDNHLEKNQTS